MGVRENVPPYIQRAIDAIMLSAVAYDIIEGIPKKSVDDLIRETKEELQKKSVDDIADITRQLTDIDINNTVSFKAAAPESSAKKTRKPWTPERREKQIAAIFARSKKTGAPKPPEKITPHAPPPPPRQGTTSVF